MDAEARRKAAAEARRAKVLARGGDRLAQITGSLPEPADVSPSVLGQQQASQPPQPAVATAAAPAPSPSVTAAVPAPPSKTPAEPAGGLRNSASAASLDSQQRAKGTATNSKWARYDAAAPRQHRRLRQVHFGEALSAAVLSTSRLRLLLAALLALLLAVRWDAASAASGAKGGWAAVQQRQQQRHAAPFAELAARWQGLVRQAKHAAAPLLGRTPEQAAEEAAEQRCRQLWAAWLDPFHARVRDAAATAAALQRPLSPRQRLEATVANAAAATAGSSCRLYSRAAAQLAAIRAGRHGSIRQLAGEAAGAATRHAHAQLAAAAASPLGQQALGYAEALPPLVSLLVVELSLVGAAAAAMVAAPRLVHSTLELELQTPGLLARLASFVPGLAQQLSLASGWQRLLTGLLDDAAAFVIALVTYYQLPALLAGGQGGDAAAAA